jgi:Zn-dependent protease with chaperone function
MTDEAFQDLVKRLEGESSRRPGLYKLRVFLLALLGYGYVFAVLGVILLLIGLGISLMAETRVHLGVEILLVFFAGLILRALWVRLPAPEGLALERREAPVLFAEVDGLRETLRTPRIHRILLTPDFNASLVQVPRLGIFGLQRNYLSVGLPLMQVLSPAGFRFVLAHELGHLSRTHNLLEDWIYRVRRTWEQLLEVFERTLPGDQWVFKKFFEWYAPYFKACSFVLARRREYEADRHAAEASSSRAAAEALVTLHVAGEYLEREFLPSVLRQAASQPAPVQIFHELERIFAAGGWKENAPATLERVLKETTDNRDTHPCLRDRLAALGEEPALPESPTPMAAQHYLGPSLLGDLTEKFQRAWTEAVADWQQRYEEARQEKERLAELTEEAQEERASLQTTDRLIDHGLDADAVSALAGQLTRYPEVKAAWLARKEVRHRPDLPAYVLGVKLGVRFRTKGYHVKYCERLALEMSFPGDYFVVSLDILPRGMKGDLKNLPGAEIYRV